MSNGPIAQARAAWNAPPVSTTDAARICLMDGRRGYCGRRKTTTTTETAKVTNADCLAAVRADEEATTR